MYLRAEAAPQRVLFAVLFYMKIQIKANKYLGVHCGSSPSRTLSEIH